MIILAWNVNRRRGGFGWVDVCNEVGADLILLQESYRPQTTWGTAWESVPHGTWGSAVISRRGTIRPVVVPNYEGWVNGGELSETDWPHAGRPCWVFSVHAPTTNAQRPRKRYVEEVGMLLAELDRIVPEEADLILGGDFNFLSLGERLPDEPLKTKPGERAVLGMLQARGLVSCWTSANPGMPLVQTLRWSNDKTTPYHCDGIFAPARWSGSLRCEVLRSQAIEAASDHNPVAAWLNP